MYLQLMLGLPNGTFEPLSSRRCGLQVELKKRSGFVATMINDVLVHRGNRAKSRAGTVAH